MPTFADVYWLFSAVPAAMEGALGLCVIVATQRWIPDPRQADRYIRVMVLVADLGVLFYWLGPDGRAGSQAYLAAPLVVALLFLHRRREFAARAVFWCALVLCFAIGYLALATISLVGFWWTLWTTTGGLHRIG